MMTGPNDRDCYASQAHVEMMPGPGPQDGPTEALVLAGTHGVLKYGMPIAGQGKVWVIWDFAFAGAVMTHDYGMPVPREKVSAR